MICCAHCNEAPTTGGEKWKRARNSRSSIRWLISRWSSSKLLHICVPCHADVDDCVMNLIYIIYIGAIYRESFDTIICQCLCLCGALALNKTSATSDNWILPWATTSQGCQQRYLAEKPDFIENIIMLNVQIDWRSSSSKSHHGKKWKKEKWCFPCRSNFPYHENQYNLYRQCAIHSNAEF